MVRVTDAAIDMLEQIEKPTEQVLRLEPDLNAGVLALQLGAPKLGDEVVEREGTDVLHVSGAVAQGLDGTVIDVVETEAGKRLRATPAG